MIFNFLASDERLFFAPEVVQTSAMDCGPAALKSLLEGFGVPVSYGRLREACQTSVDGTSIDTIEEVANQLGLQAEQVMVPADHLLLYESQSLPALVVVQQPNGLTHFVVVWRRHGAFVQVMDPATGRRWQQHQRFLSQLYIHQLPVPAEAWREWAGSDGFCNPLQERMRLLRLREEHIQHLLKRALAEPAWRPLAVLDAATRMVEGMVRAKALKYGKEAGQVLERFFTQVAYLADDVESTQNGASRLTIPESYWSVLPPSAERSLPDGHLLLQGAVLIRILGQHGGPSDLAADPVAQPLTPELLAALEETPTDPLRELWRLLKQDGFFAPAVLGIALAMGAVGVMIEALLFRGLLDLGLTLNLLPQRVITVAILFIFLLGLFLLEWPIANMVARFGRRLESRLRIKFFEKIPRLGDRYFHSRLTSDMAQRAHELRQVRLLPQLGISWLRLVFEILFTALGVMWLNPSAGLLALMAIFFAVGFSIITQPLLVEQDLVLRTHVGALSGFYLDALLGLMPIRTHSAERAVRRQHENLLVEWVHASQRFYQADTAIRIMQSLLGSFFAFWILYDYLAVGSDPRGVLLLFYWALRLPALGQALAQVTQQYPMQRNRVLRLLEPLGAAEESDLTVANEEGTVGLPSKKEGITIALHDLSVQAGGHTILSNINLTIPAGQHIAIVGPSGAGKSSLVGMLLGWHRAATGQLLVDGLPLQGQCLLDLRRQTAWVDPAVQLWNRTLLHNLNYGAQGENPDLMNVVIEQAELLDVLETLPQGLQTSLGEGGGLLSGGQGQRVRLGRAMRREGVRLVILDEPFRGLDRTKRQALLNKARHYWKDATLIFISHDVGQTQDFERVLVIEQGQIVADDTPKSLLEQQNSRYHALLKAEEVVRTSMWERKEWRKLWLEQGRLSTKSEDSMLKVSFIKKLYNLKKEQGRLIGEESQ